MPDAARSQETGTVPNNQQRKGKLLTALAAAGAVCVAVLVLEAGHVHDGVVAAAAAAVGPPLPPHRVRHQLHHVAERLPWREAEGINMWISGSPGVKRASHA